MRFKLGWSKNRDKDRKKDKYKDKDRKKDKYKGWKSTKKREEENIYRGTYNKKWGLEKNLHFFSF